MLIVPLQPFSQDYGLASHEWLDLQLKDDFELILIFEKPFHGSFIYRRNIFFYISFWCLTWDITQGFTSIYTTSKIVAFGAQKTRGYIEKPMHTNRATVWWRFLSRGIIRPFFFENEQGEDVIVNGDHYRAMLNEFLFTKIEEEDIGNIRFQQDGATCHTLEATLDV